MAFFFASALLRLCALTPHDWTYTARAHFYFEEKGRTGFWRPSALSKPGSPSDPSRQQNDNLCICEFQESFKTKAQLPVAASVTMPEL